MPKPILLAIDDDTSVLEAVVQDLRRHYGQDYRIVRAASGAAALDICRQLQERKDIVALFLSDQRMPGMTGVDFLQQAIPLYPDAKRVLLTAYADTEAAIRAINSAKIHYYLNKPWDPPEEKLYPVLDDLLETWKQGYKPPYEGIIVVGTRWSSADHNVREFLSRNRIPYKWLSPEQHPEAVTCSKSAASTTPSFPSSSSAMAPRSSSPPQTISPPNSACHVRPSRSSTMSSSSAPGPRVWLQVSTPHPRASPPSSSKARPSAARRAPAPGSKTTLDSRRVSAGPISQTAPTSRLSVSAPNFSLSRSPASAATTSTRSSRWGMAARSRAMFALSPPVSPTASSTSRAPSSSPAQVSITAPHSLKPSPAKTRSSTSSAEQTPPGRPGCTSPATPATSICSSAATRSPRACPSTSSTRSPPRQTSLWRPAPRSSPCAATDTSNP